jgi:hypothetical protein
MSNQLDALVYAGLINNIPVDSNQDSEFSLLVRFAGAKDQPDVPAQKQYIEDRLSNTTIKRACCMAKRNSGKIDTDNTYTVNVKIPIPPGDNTLNPTGQKFGYKNIPVKVPLNMCNSVFKNYSQSSGTKGLGNQECDDFMGSYCTNMKYLYNSEKPNKKEIFNYYEFSNYAPECPCYADLPDWYVDPKNPTGVLNGIARSCILDNCGFDTNTSYLDASSREGCPASVNICNSITKIGNISASQGAEVNITGRVQQQCGPQLEQLRKEEDAKKKAEEDAKKKTEEDAKKKTEEDAKKKAEEDAKKKAEEDAKKKTDQTKTDQTKTDQTKTDQTKTDQTKTDQTKTDQTKTDKPSEPSSILLYVGIGGGILFLLLICAVVIFVGTKKNKNNKKKI